MANQFTAVLGVERDIAIRKHMGEWNFPDGFTIKDTCNTEEVVILFSVKEGGDEDPSSRVREHMKSMVRNNSDVVVYKGSGSATYSFRVDLNKLLNKLWRILRL